MNLRAGVFAIALTLSACGGSGAGNQSAVAENEAGAAANTAETRAALPACPFLETTDWAGSIEAGRLLVTGSVDLQMAGFRPALTERAAGSGTLALDLALAPEPNAPVTDLARYERRGAPAYQRGEIWCGGERIAEFDIVNVG